MASLGDIIFNYKELWMSFYWQGQKVLLLGSEAINLQTVRLEQLNGWLTNSSQLVEINLCSLRIVIDEEGFVQLISTALIPEMKRDPTFKELLMKHQDVFKKPKRLPIIESHDHSIPLNQLTIKDKSPILLVNELIEKLIGTTIFSKMDLRFGYHYIIMALRDVFKTAFQTHNGHFEFLVMLFGLSNILVTF